MGCRVGSSVGVAVDVFFFFCFINESTILDCVMVKVKVKNINKIKRLELIIFREVVVRNSRNNFIIPKIKRFSKVIVKQMKKVNQ